MADARLASIRAAERTTREMRALFGRLGTEEHPRGRIRRAYRNARRALSDVVARASGIAAYSEAREVLGALRREVTDAGRIALHEAVSLGLDQATQERDVWGLGDLGDERPDVELALTGWMGVVDAQIEYALMILALGGDVALILGDETRLGRLRHSEITEAGAELAMSLAILAMIGALGRPLGRSRMQWSKQAIAAIDERTTDCCLRVHGQVVPFDADFKLTGTPRYADEMEWSPFHRWCRTSIAMAPTRWAEDDLTDQMRDAARAELAARKETGKHIEIHPAHARSRRG